MKFDEAADGYEALRRALATTYRERKTEKQTLSQAEEFHQGLMTAGAIAAVPKLPHHTAVTKFRKGESKRLRLDAARPLWDFFLHTRPQLLGVENHSEATFMSALCWYYDVDRRKQAILAPRLQDCTYLVYHFTEMLAGSMADAVVVGEFRIKAIDPQLLQVTERQSYDGHLGRSASKETNIGFCFPKFQSVCMLLKDGGNAPKFYDFHQHGVGEGDKISWMKGRLARISPGAPLFGSNAYAVRVPANHGEQLNIFAPQTIPRAILAELKHG